jgi:hypothetical protein
MRTNGHDETGSRFSQLCKRAKKECMKCEMQMWKDFAADVDVYEADKFNPNFL